MAKPYFRYQIQYRYNGSWTMGYTYLTKPEAENYAQRTGRDYRIVTIKG